MFRLSLEDSSADDFDERGSYLFLVIQHCEDLSFDASDGQCIKIGNDAPELAIVDCSDSSIPDVENIASTVNAILTSVRVAFDVTAPIDTVVDHAGYITTDHKLLHLLQVTGNARLSVMTLLDPGDASNKAVRCRNLASKITDAVNGKGAKAYAADFPRRLDDLTEALQLDPSTDEGYLRLWFLRLYYCAEEFGNSCGWKFTNANVDIREHRRYIAHKGVEQLDGRMRQLCQRMIHRKIASELGP